MKRAKVVSWGGLLASVLLCGCSSWPKHGVEPHPPRKLSIALLPVRFDVRIKKLKEIENPPSPPLSKEAEQAQVAARTRELAQELTASFDERLKATYFFVPIDTADVAQALEEEHISSQTFISTSTFSSLGQKLHADAFLRVTVLGYGRIKRSWVFFLLGSGLVEGASQGAIVAGATGNPFAAIAVAGEEVVQETVEDVGGIFFFNQFFTPVILEAELISAKDGRVAWRRWSMATRDRKALKKLPPEERAKKDVRLKVVFEHTRDKLVKSLEKAALKNEIAAPGAD